MPEPHFLLAIPVFNEERYVSTVLNQARDHASEILVVDDGSTDGTPELVARQQGLNVIQHDVNLGYGRSLRDAFEFALRQEFDWLITMDCDEQHEPSYIAEFRSAALRDDADLISGSRYLTEMPGNTLPPPERRMINQRITALLNERLGLELTDAFCGFKAYRVEALKKLHITEDGYAMPLQFWVQAVRAGWKVRELAVPLVYRDDTRSFGGGLDEPQRRLRHYLSVFEREMARGPTESRSGCGRRIARACI